MSLDAYIAALDEKFRTGVSTEHTHRGALETYLVSLDDNLVVINEPQRVDVGAPDFEVRDGHGPAALSIGIIECKDIGKDLNAVERGEQMQRYHKLENVILTDYLEFRWYVKGEKRQSVRVADINGDRITPLPDNYSALGTLLSSYQQYRVPPVNTARELAERMAGMAQLIRDFIIADLDSNSPDKELVARMNAFRKTLLPEIDDAEFADMYAQTITYGLFAARMNYNGGTFTRESASRSIPQTNPFLRKLFHNISFDVGRNINWVVDRLATLLSLTDTDDVLAEFGKATRQQDPIVHFYETFLAQYDPATREKRGVYYTPEPVVSYIVRSVDHILKTTFGRTDGLGDPDTLILDPATGTGTFLYFVIQHIHEQFNRDRDWRAYAQQHLLRRIFGFELLMAPYTVAHMKLGLQLKQLGYQFDDDQRLGIYLTNTLEEGVKKEEEMFEQYIADEANAAASIKRDEPIMVVLGNPPYSGYSANDGTWINNLLTGRSPNGETTGNYYEIDGKPLREQKVWLKNDYVKFIRFGQWRIEKTGSGILAFITDNSFLDGVTFRGMRQQLMNTFSGIYVLNLHGNSKKKETAPDGTQDVNVFDIQQGVCITIFVKRESDDQLARLYYQDVWGTRAHKYSWLNQAQVDQEWESIEPTSPYYQFIPQDRSLESEYNKGWVISTLFPTNSVGIQTSRDYFAVDFDSEVLIARIADLRNQHYSTSSLRKKYFKGKGPARFPDGDSSEFKLEDVRKIIQADPNWSLRIESCLYRPFDTRVVYYADWVLHRTRDEVMQHMKRNKPNIGFIMSRGVEISRGFEHVFATEDLITNHAVSIKEGNYLAPLYIYPEKRIGELPLDIEEGWPLSEKGRRPNLNKDFVDEMAGKLGLQFITEGTGDRVTTFGPEDIFHYAYAVFHSPSYRERYAEFLKIDFPRLPLTSDGALFQTLCAKGAQLVQWHLMTHPSQQSVINLPPYRFSGEGNDEVVRAHPKYNAEQQRVYINKTQYFENIPPDLWDFHIGGYQVLEKWLKDRKGRTLSFDEQIHYGRVALALENTMRLMDEIDDAIPAFPLA